LLGRLLDDPDELRVFTEDEQMLFARFLATHRFRVPAFRAQMDAMRAQTLGFMKETGRAWLWNQHKGDEAAAAKIWKEWEQKPVEWWTHERRFDAAELTAKMFMGVQGYANLLWSMPWRIGRVPPHIRLHTSGQPTPGVSAACAAMVGERRVRVDGLLRAALAFGAAADFTGEPPAEGCSGR
jgi:hypothetical protein